MSPKPGSFSAPFSWFYTTFYPQIYMRFLEYEMHNSNECKRNFVAIYDGSSSVEHLKNKFCSTVANDVMLASSVGVVRLWADEGSRKSKFRILFTTFHEREWISVSSILSGSGQAFFTGLPCLYICECWSQKMIASPQWVWHFGYFSTWWYFFPVK